MDYLNLPQRTKVQKVIPKNTFDSFTNTKQKKILTDKVSRITWTHKLSKDTVNLAPKEITEIQIFKIELKVKEEINSIVEIIDKVIPYNIIFIIEFGESLYLSSSVKHPHPTNEDISVIDWTFKTKWINAQTANYQLNLKKDLDAVFKDFCVQIAGEPELSKKNLSSIVKHQQEVNDIKNEIERLKSQIAGCKQFNKKVEINLELKSKESDLKLLQNS